MGDITGVRICRGAPMVSHLLFADDCFLFCRASVTETTNLLNLLHVYEAATGQQVNLSKSEVFISRNLSVAAQEDLASILGVKHAIGTGTYLGLPSMVGRNKKAIFSFLKDRVWKKLNSWRGRSLSKTGKEVMIKSVLQAIPSYIMSVYLIPSSVIEEMERMINGFWWGGGSNNRGIRWMAWSKMTSPKCLGGLGFQDFGAFNKAMLAKQGWRILQNPEALVSRVLKAKYFPNSSFLDARLGNSPSFSWRSLWMSREVLMGGCRWSIGDGSKVRVMYDPWLRQEGRWWVSSPQKEEIYSLYVSDLMLEGEKKWDNAKIGRLFTREEAAIIMSTPLFAPSQEDRLVWEGDKDGSYSVRLGYRLLMRKNWEKSHDSRASLWGSLWKVNAPPKSRHLLWRLCKECIPTRARLAQRRVNCPITCPSCNDDVEDDYHAFFTCNHAITCWAAAGLSHVVHNRFQYFDNVPDLILNICSLDDADTAGRIALLLWTIWQSRNDALWNSHRPLPTTIAQQAVDTWQAWNNTQNLRHQRAQQPTQQQPTIGADTSWTLPQIGWHKCNVDAAFLNDGRYTTTAACFRDYQGEFIYAKTQCYSARMSILEGEAMALLDAICFARLQGLCNVIFESDSNILVNCIGDLSARNGSSDFQSIITSIRHELANLHNFEVKFVRRQANMVAHTLAKAAISWSCPRVFDCIPPCITTLINKEKR